MCPSPCPANTDGASLTKASWAAKLRRKSIQARGDESMPTYEYQCQQCGHRSEQFQTITAKSLAKCRQCKGRLQRLIGAGAAVITRSSGAGAPLPCGARGSCPSGDGRCMMGRGDG